MVSRAGRVPELGAFIIPVLQMLVLERNFIDAETKEVKELPQV